MSEYKKDQVHETIRSMRLKGSTLQEIADALNKKKLWTRRGNSWTEQTVGHYGLRHKLIFRVANTKAGTVGSSGIAIQGKKRHAEKGAGWRTVRVNFEDTISGITSETPYTPPTAPLTVTDFGKVAQTARIIAEIAESNLRAKTKRELISFLRD